MVTESDLLLLWENIKPVLAEEGNEDQITIISRPASVAFDAWCEGNKTGG